MGVGKWGGEGYKEWREARRLMVGYSYSEHCSGKERSGRSGIDDAGEGGGLDGALATLRIDSFKLPH